MGEYKETEFEECAITENIHETLYMRPSWHNEFSISQAIAIASLINEKEISIIMNKIGKHPTIPSFCHMIFTEKEVDIIIEALQEAKRQWKYEK
jgi:glutaminase